MFCFIVVVYPVAREIAHKTEYMPNIFKVLS